MQVIDVHCHLGKSIDGTEGTADELIAIMDSCGIDKSVVFPMNSDDSGITYEIPNQAITKAVQQNPERFIGFCRVQPKAGEKAILELESCIQKGFKGLKLHPRSDSFNKEDCTDLIKKVDDLKVPVIIHTDHYEFKTPGYWETTFKEFKNVNFILAHSGKDAFLEAGRIAKELPNVFLDTSTLSFNRTRVLFKDVGADKIIFASDYPYSHPEIEKRKFELIVSDSNDLQKIFWYNLQKILNF